MQYLVEIEYTQPQEIELARLSDSPQHQRWLGKRDTEAAVVEFVAEVVAEASVPEIRA